MMNALAELEIYQAGELTVLGFGGREYLDQLDLSVCYEELMELIREFRCQSLAIDLTGVHWIPSGLIGVLLSAHRYTPDIHIFNPSDDVRTALEVAHLDTVFQLHQIEI